MKNNVFTLYTMECTSIWRLTGGWHLAALHCDPCTCICYSGRTCILRGNYRIFQAHSSHCPGEHMDEVYSNQEYENFFWYLIPVRKRCRGENFRFARANLSFLANPHQSDCLQLKILNWKRLGKVWKRQNQNKLRKSQKISQIPTIIYFCRLKETA